MKDAARLAGVSVELLRYYANSGTVETERTIGGHRLVIRDSLIRALGLNVDDEVTSDDQAERLNVIYARVSTDKQRKEGNLTGQVERFERFAAETSPANQPSPFRKRVRVQPRTQRFCASNRRHLGWASKASPL